MHFKQAAEIAEAWVRVTSHGAAAIWREKTIAMPYGWVFFYNAPEFIENPENHTASLVGNVPILVERVNGDVRVLGVRYKEVLAALEAQMPPARLQMRPELPAW
jgi:hypothetical protein